MTSLLAPELERYLTRRTTWIGALTMLGLLGLASIMIAMQDMSSYRGEVELATTGPGMILVATALVGAWAYFTAASAVGSEQSSGALGTWLTFNPRRGRVYAAKLLAVAVPAAAVATVALFAAVGWSMLISDRSHPTAVEWMTSAAVRGVLVVISLAVLGFVIALVGRSTLSALGVLVGWLVLVALQAFFSSVSSSYWHWIGLERLLGEFLLNSTGYSRHGAMSYDLGVVFGAGLLWFGVVAAILLAGWALFARRDID